MTSAATSFELDAPAGMVWHVLADLDRYSDWNPCFSAVRGALRANDRLDVELRLPDRSPRTRSVSALVVDVCRHRGLRWLLLPPASDTADQSSAPPEVGVYDVELVPLGPSRVRLVQRLSLAPGAQEWTTDRDALRQTLAATNAALSDRVAWAVANQSPARQIDGTIRVSSHYCRSPGGSARHPGLTGSLAERVGGKRRGAAA